MAKVKALYSYTYVYEGSKISFHCGDEFQLLAKVNPDWWHVRRWVGKDCSQDIYIPAVYVKEVGSEENPLYQNMSELKKQVEDFKKKESSTPPPPTARKPRPDRAGSDKSKAAISGSAPKPSSPEKKSAAAAAPETTESVADLAKRLAETMQAKKPPPEGEGGGGGGGGSGASKVVSSSPLVVPKRSQSTRRLESPSSPRHGRKLQDGGGGVITTGNPLPVASKPRSYSISARPLPAEGRREKGSMSPPELVLQHGEPPPPANAAAAAAAKSGPGAKSKLPPPVLPKAGKLRRPNSMVMFSPTEGGEAGNEDPFAASFQSQLSEQVKKVQSASSLGAVSGGGGAGGAEPKGGPVREDVQNSAPHSGKVRVIIEGAFTHKWMVCVTCV